MFELAIIQNKAKNIKQHMISVQKFNRIRGDTFRELDRWKYRIDEVGQQAEYCTAD